MLLNYHIGRFVLHLLCVGVRVRFGWGGIRAAGCHSAAWIPSRVFQEYLYLLCLLLTIRCVTSRNQCFII